MVGGAVKKKGEGGINEDQSSPGGVVRFYAIRGRKQGLTGREGGSGPHLDAPQGLLDVCLQHFPPGERECLVQQPQRPVRLACDVRVTSRLEKPARTIFGVRCQACRPFERACSGSMATPVARLARGVLKGGRHLLILPVGGSGKVPGPLAGKRPAG